MPGVLIAEMLLLVAITDNGRMPWGRGAFVTIGLSGALLAELAIGGQLTVAADGRVGAVGARPSDELLARVYDAAREQLEGRKARRVVGSLNRRIGGSQAQVAGRLATAGVLGQGRPSRWRPARYRVIDAAARQAVLDEVRMAAAGTGPVRPQVAVVLALAGPCRLLEQVAPDRRTRAAARRRMAEATAEASFAPPVADSIDKLVSAVAAAAAAIAASG